MFDHIIGNEKIKQELVQAVNQNKIAHSYLFIGTEGIGKKQIAKEFAKMLLGDLNNNPDFQMIEPEGLSIKIEQIRQMQKKIIEAPIKSTRKVYIIDDADLMTVEAQNCLLKTLEEPPEFAIIILIGSRENNFLSTIKSRCTIIKFQNIENSQIKEYLKEKYQITDFSEEMLEVSGGSIGKAEQLKDKQELYNVIFEIIDKIDKLDLIEVLKKANVIYKSQEDIQVLLENINVILFNKSKQNIKCLNCIDIVEETKKRLNSNANYNMCIDNMLFNIWEEIH